MKRVMLLALVALALPKAALAGRLTYETKHFVSGTFSGSFTTMLDVTVVGIENTIQIKPRPRDSWVIYGSALRLIEKAVEFAAGRIEGELVLF